MKNLTLLIAQRALTTAALLVASASCVSSDNGLEHGVSATPAVESQSQAATTTIKVVNGHAWRVFKWTGDSNALLAFIGSSTIFVPSGASILQSAWTKAPAAGTTITMQTSMRTPITLNATTLRSKFTTCAYSAVRPYQLASVLSALGSPVELAALQKYDAEVFLFKDPSGSIGVVAFRNGAVRFTSLSPGTVQTGTAGRVSLRTPAPTTDFNHFLATFSTCV